MPAYPSPEEMRDVGARVTQLAIEHYADNRDALLRLARDYFLDHDPYDIKRIAEQLRSEMLGHATLVLQRRLRLEARGLMCEPGKVPTGKDSST